MVAPIKVSADDPELQDLPVASTPIKVSPDDPELLDAAPLQADDPSAAAFARGLNAPPRYFSNPTDQAIADIPYVRQAYRGAAGALDSLKALGYRGKAIFHSATDAPAYADEANAQADAILAEKARRDEAFQKTSGAVANLAAGAVESIGSTMIPAMIGGPAAAIATASGTQGNEAYMAGRNAGLTGTSLAQHVASQMVYEGVPATMSQFAGVGGIEQRASEIAKPIERGIKAALARYGKSLKEELPEELVTTYMEQAGAAQAGVGDASPEALEKGAFDTMATVLMTSGLAEVPSILASPRTPKDNNQTNTPPPANGDTAATPITPLGPNASTDEAFDAAFSELYTGEPTEQPAPVEEQQPTNVRTFTPQADPRLQNRFDPARRPQRPSLPDTLPPLSPGAEIPVQGIAATIAQQQDLSSKTQGDPFADKEFEEKKGTAVTFKTSEPMEITDKYGSYRVSYQIANDGDGFRLQRIDEDGTKSHLGDDGLWYRTDQPMPSRRDNIVMPEKYRTEAQAKRAALEDAAGIGWGGFSAVSESAASGKTAPAENPRVAPIAPGSAVLRPVPTLTPEQQAAWMAEADALAPAEQEIVADYLMENPGNPEQLSPGEIVARSNRDIWRFTPEQQAEYEKAMGITAQESEVIGNEEKGQEAPLLSAETGAGVDVPAPAPSPAAGQGSPAPQQQVATTTGLERLTWNELTSMSEEANRGRDANTLQSVLDEVRARKAIGNSGPRLATTPTPAPTPTPTPPTPAPPTPTPIRFKRSGKGNTAVHEATVEGRAVSIAKGKDGWEVRLDGEVADVLPTLADARGYAMGELRQDLMDQRNAAEEEGLGADRSEQPYTFTEKETAANALIRKAWEKGKSGEDLGLSSPEPDARVVSRKVYDKAMNSHADFTASELERNADATWDVNRSGDGSQVILTPKRGPAPADTGIYRDLTAAAREGKRFVAELHERIVPALTRIYQQSKNAVDFMKRAIAKIGEHIRPYAKRFIAEVKRGVRETRGAAINPGQFLQSRRRPAPAAMSTAKGKTGYRYHADEAAALIREWKKTVPVDEWRARAKGFEAAAKNKDLDPDKRRRNMEKVLDKIKADLDKRDAVGRVRKAMAIKPTELAKMTPEARDALAAILNAYLSTKPSQASIDKAQSMIDALDVGFVEEGQISPKRIQKYRSILDAVSGNKRDLRSLTVPELNNLYAAIQKAKQINEDAKKRIVDYDKAQRIAADTFIPEELRNSLPGRKADARLKSGFRDKMMFAWLNLDNLVRYIGGVDSMFYRTLFTEPTKGIHAVNNISFTNADILKRMMAEQGITEEDMKAMSPTYAGWFERTGLGQRLARKKNQPLPPRTITLSDGRKISLYGAEIVDLLNAFRDPDTFHELMKPGSKGFETARGAGQENAKISPDDARAIAAMATPKERAVADVLFRWANGPLRQQVNEWSIEHLGYELFPLENVWSRTSVRSNQEPGQSLFDMSTRKMFAESIRQTHSRVGGGRLRVHDGLQAATSHMNDMAFLMGMYRPSRDARRLLDSDGVKDAVRDGLVNGNVVLNEIRERLTNIMSVSHGKPDTFLPYAQDLGRRITIVSLAANLHVIASQPFSYFAATKFIPAKHIFGEVKPYGKQKVEQIRKEIREARNGLRRVMDSGGFRVMTPESFSPLALHEVFGNGKNEYSDKMMRAMEKSNDAALYRIWEAAKAYGRENGLTGQDLMDFTADLAEDAWHGTQPSDNPMYATGKKLGAKTSTYHYATSMFQGQTGIMFNDAMNEAIDLRVRQRAGRATPEDYKAAVTSYARAVLAQSLMFSVAGLGTQAAYEAIKGLATGDWPDEDEASKKYSRFMKNLVLGSSIGIVPGALASVVESIYNHAKGLMTDSYIPSSSISPLLGVLDRITDVTNDLKDGELTTRGKRGMAYLMGLIVPAPITNLPEYLEILSGRSDGE